MNSTGGVFPLLTLPNEILGLICDHLTTIAEFKALAALRLTCKQLVQIPESNLFHQILLNAQIESLSMLEALSQHPRLRGHVQLISIEAEPMFESLTHEGWKSGLKSCEATQVKVADDVFNLHLYRRAIAKAKQQMDELEIEVAWKKYRAGFKSQEALAQSSVGLLQRRLGLAMSRMPNLNYLECTATFASRYRFDHFDFSPPNTFPAMLEALAYPRFREHDQFSDKCSLSAEYIAAAMYGMLCYAANPISVDVAGLPRQTLESLGELIRLNGPPPFLQNLRVLKLDFQSRFRVRSGLNRQANRGLQQILRAAPNLGTFKCTLRGPFDPGADVGRSLLTIDSRPAVDGSYFHKLAELCLAEVELREDRLAKMLIKMASTLRKVHIQSVELKEGRWVDIFSLMRKLQMQLVSLHCIDYLYESFAYERDMVWEICERHDDDEVVTVHGGLWKDVLDGILGKTMAPFRSSEEGGHVQEWIMVVRQSPSDCVVYEEWTD